MFSDALPTGAIDSFLQNAPLDPGFVHVGGYIAPQQTGPNVLTLCIRLSQAANASQLPTGELAAGG